MAHMKLLIIGHPLLSLNTPIVHYMKSAGWEVALDTISQTHIPWTDRVIVKTANKLLHATRLWRHPSAFKETVLSCHGSTTRSMVRSVLREKPDVILHISGSRFWKREMQKVSKDFPMVLWMVEPLEFFQGILDTAEEYQKIFVYGSDWHKALDAFHIPSNILLHSWDPSVFHPPAEKVTPRYSWSFVGRHTIWRQRCLESLAAAAGNGLIKGGGWQERLGSTSPLHACWQPGEVHDNDLNTLFHESEIVVDLSQGRLKPGAGLTPRFFHALGSGARILCDTHPDHGLIGQDQNRIQSFDQPDEIPEAYNSLKSRNHLPPLQRDPMEGWKSLEHTLRACASVSKSS